MPPTPHNHNWVTGHMGFRRSYVRELLAEIEGRHRMDWTTAVCAVMAQGRPNNTDIEHFFSEYQTYGAWLNRRHSDSIGRVETISLIRDPAIVMRGVRRRQCCVPEETVCEIADERLRRHDPNFYIILEEHKWRVRDRRCNDSWHHSDATHHLRHQRKIPAL